MCESILKRLCNETKLPSWLNKYNLGTPACYYLDVISGSEYPKLLDFVCDLDRRLCNGDYTISLYVSPCSNFVLIEGEDVIGAMYLLIFDIQESVAYSYHSGSIGRPFSNLHFETQSEITKSNLDRIGQSEFDIFTHIINEYVSAYVST